MATAKDLALYVEQEDLDEGLRVVSPNGVPKLNRVGVDLANILRGEGERREFVFAEPVAIVGLEPDGKYIVQVGTHTRMLVDPDNDNYFL